MNQRKREVGLDCLLKPTILMETPCNFEHLPNEILYIIMRKLNGRDLSNAAMVCRHLLNVVNYEKSLRGPHCVVIRHDANTDEELQLDSIRNLPIKSVIGLFFIPLDFRDFIDLYYDSFSELLPRNCEILMLFTHIAILNEEIHESQYSRYRNIVCAFLPQTLNVQLSMAITEGLNACIQMIETASRHHESSMCLMLFCFHGDLMPKEYLAEIAKLKFKNNERISLCGGMMELLEFNEIHPSSVAVLITGSIQTWSVVLEIEIRELFEEKLQIFKEQVQLRKHTVCFVFYSYHRFLKNINKELKMFKQLFPNIPLIGCSCQFVFGRDTATYEAKFLRSQNEKWYKESSIVFTILTYC